MPSMSCSASGTLPYRWVSSEPARTRAPLGSLGTEGLQDTCLYRPESEAQEHFSLDLIMWEKCLRMKRKKGLLWSDPCPHPLAIPWGWWVGGSPFGVMTPWTVIRGLCLFSLTLRHLPGPILSISSLH